MYRHVPHSDIAGALMHIRGLFRRVKPSDERAFRARERLEATIRDLLLNLPRTNQHPTLKMILEIAETCCLTLEGAHRLFGYNLGEIREYDLRLNGGRTHIEGRHQRSRPGEVHRPLGMGHACKRERKKRRPQHVGCATKIVFGERVSQSLGTEVGLAQEHCKVSAVHRHLHRLGLSREYAVMIGQFRARVQYFLFIG